MQLRSCWLDETDSGSGLNLDVEVDLVFVEQGAGGSEQCEDSLATRADSGPLALDRQLDPGRAEAGSRAVVGEDEPRPAAQRPAPSPSPLPRQLRRQHGDW